ncbi:MAG: hypothetical protein QGF36_01745 [Candidatus Marinimicrobia bacterium]|nr:hypothetical protein [Candidatus Neomarinimicrobiota bacterium]
MKSILTLCLAMVLFSGCTDDNGTNPEISATEITFVLCEGAYGENDGTLWQIKDGVITEVSGNPTGNTPTSMAVYKNTLLVVNNGSGNILEYSITNDGIVSQTGRMLNLDGSEPREILILNDKAYVTQWKKNTLAVINLTDLTLNASIELEGSAEGITTDGTSLFVVMKYADISTWTAGNSVVKINPDNNSVSETYSIHEGPEQIMYKDGYLFVTSTYYDENWNSGYAISKINVSDGTVTIEDHGSDKFFGGDLAMYENSVFRIYQKGIAPYSTELTVVSESEVNLQQSGIYSMKINGDLLYLGVGDFSAPDQVLIANMSGEVLDTFDVGANPGSFAFWKSN